MQDLFQKLELRNYKRLVWWSDVGPHFRAGLFLNWWLVGTLNTIEHVAEVFIKWFPGGHGKGPCDGHFGAMALWKESAARQRVI
eukprot:10426312-Karenia_brevis.AAC.1